MPKRTFNVPLKNGSRELFFDNEAMYAFEELHGESINKIINEEAIGFRALNHLVYAGLLHDKEQRLSLAEVKKQMPMSSFEDIATIVAKAVNHAMEGDQGKNAQSDQPD